MVIWIDMVCLALALAPSCAALHFWCLYIMLSKSYLPRRCDWKDVFFFNTSPYVYLCFICSIHFHDIIITYPSNLYNISCSVSDPPILPSLLYQPPLRQNSTHACDGSAHRDEDCPPNINATGGPRREDLYDDCMTFGVSPIVWRFVVYWQVSLYYILPPILFKTNLEVETSNKLFTYSTI